MVQEQLVIYLAFALSMYKLIYIVCLRACVRVRVCVIATQIDEDWTDGVLLVIDWLSSDQ